MKTLDFMIIGAQKCATTTLFEHLRSHPQIAMPLEKEVPFFTSSDCSSHAWQSYAETQFAGAREAQLWGKATPQYMCDPLAAARIKHFMPTVKLVAILRDPIERTLSHYKMGKRRDTETRAFEEAIPALLDPGHIRNAAIQAMPNHEQGYQSEGDFYVSWSEYGRVLNNFSEHFPTSQLLVLYAEDLQEKPEETLDCLLKFIGLEPGFRPSTLGKVIHRGGSKKRIPQSVRQRFREQKLLYRLWQLIPETRRGQLRFRYEQWNIAKQEAQQVVPEPLRDALREHYARDIEQLLTLPVAIPPWAARYGVSK